MYTAFVMNDKLQQLKKERLKRLAAAEKDAAAAEKKIKAASKPKKSIFGGFGKKKKPAKKAAAATATWQWLDDSGWKNYQSSHQSQLEARYVRDKR